MTFLKPDQNREVAFDKQSAVDVICQNALGQHYIVEMQVVHRKGFEKRAQYYAARAYSR